MKITPQCVAALTWTLKDTQGELLDELEDPIDFLIGSHDLLIKIEESLQGHEVGDVLELHLEPEEAFGDYNENLVFLESRVFFMQDVEEGTLIAGQALPPQCNPDAPRDLIYTVTDVYPEHIVLDGNHPLAGFALRLRLKVENVREATIDEIGQGTLGVGFFKVEAPSLDLSEVLKNRTLH